MIRFALVLLLMGLGAPVDACSRIGGAPRLAEMVSTADEKFIARVVSAKEKFLRDQDEVEPYIEARYRLIETLKGHPRKTGIVQDLPFGPGNCSLGLMVGWDYLFMIQGSSSEVLKRWVGMYSGSFPLGPYRDEDSESQERDLDELRTILKTHQEREIK